MVTVLPATSEPSGVLKIVTVLPATSDLSEMLKMVTVLPATSEPSGVLRIVTVHPASSDLSEMFVGWSFSTSPRHFIMHYNKKRHDQLYAFLETLEDPDLQLFTRALLSSAPDPRGDLKATMGSEWKRQTGRLIDVARILKDHKFQDEKIRDRTLEQVVLDPFAAAILAGVLKEEFKTTNVSAIPGLRDYTAIEREMRLPATHAWLELTKGNDAPLKQTYNDIKNGGSTEYYRNEAFEALVLPIWNTVFKRAFVMPTEELTSVMKGCQFNYQDYSKNDRHFTDHDEAACAMVIAAIFANKVTEHDAWLAGIDATQRKEIVTSLDGHSTSVLNAIASTLKSQTPARLPLEKRIEVTTAYFSDPMIRGGFARSGKNAVFKNLVKRKVLSEDEMLDAGTVLEESWPRGGHAASELAIFAKTRGNYETAVTWIDQALSRVPAVKKPLAIRGMFLLEKVKIQIDAENLEAARMTMAEFEKAGDAYRPHFGRAKPLQTKLR